MAKDIKAKTTNGILNFLFGWQFAPLLILAGVTLRLKHYFDNRSLWLDEAWLSLGISRQTLSEIIDFKLISNDLPLPPAGFMLLEKLATIAFGNSEFALRLLPLFCSILAMGLFYILLKEQHNKKIIPIALGLFVINDPLIYYAGEVKQYSSDLALTLFLYIAVFKIKDRKLTLGFTFFLLLSGVIALYMSHVACFVLSAIIIALFFGSCQARDWDKCIKVVFLGFIWALIFFALYVLSYWRMSENPSLQSGAQKASYYLADPLFSVGAVKWAAGLFVGIFKYPLEITPAWLWAGIFLIGLVEVFRRDKQKGVLLISPLLLIFAAGVFQKYPFGDRFILFTMPLILIILAEGVVLLIGRALKFKSISGGLLMGLLFIYPLQAALSNFSQPRRKEEVRPAINYLVARYKPGDAVYLNNASQYALGYYLQYHNFNSRLNLIGTIPNWPSRDTRYPIYFEYYYCGFNEDGFLTGFANVNYFDLMIDKDLQSIENNKRTWLFLSHEQALEKQWTLDYFDRNGKRIDELEFPGASIYLFDMSQANMQEERRERQQNNL